MCQLYFGHFVLAMIKDIVKKKLGIKPEPSSLSDNAAEGNEDASVPKRIVTEAGV